jgi:hypothetical protein
MAHRNLCQSIYTFQLNYSTITAEGAVKVRIAMPSGSAGDGDTINVITAERLWDGTEIRGFNIG